MLSIGCVKTKGPGISDQLLFERNVLMRMRRYAAYDKSSATRGLQYKTTRGFSISTEEGRGSGVEGGKSLGFAQVSYGSVDSDTPASSAWRLSTAHDAVKLLSLVPNELKWLQRFETLLKALLVFS